MTSRPVNLGAVRRTLAKLDALALERPHLVGGPTDDAAVKSWEQELAPILGAEVETMAAKKKGEPMKVQAFRLPAALLARLDRYAVRLAKVIGLNVSRTDALRHALGKALDQADHDFAALEQARREEASGKLKKK